MFTKLDASWAADQCPIANQGGLGGINKVQPSAEAPTRQPLD